MPPKKKEPAKPDGRKQATYLDRLSRLRLKASGLAERHGMQMGYRSGLEFKLGKTLLDMGIEFEFEGLKIKWIPLPIEHTYNPDFIIEGKNGKTLIIESKGRFMPDDMAKHLAVKAQHPELEVKFVFQNSGYWYRKAKTRSYAKWCEENGFDYCDIKDFSVVIKRWMKEVQK